MSACAANCSPSSTNSGTPTRIREVRRSTSTFSDHYFHLGWKEGRNPSSWFDTSFYRRSFMFGDASDICPLEHYRRYGMGLGLPTNALQAHEKAVRWREGVGDETQQRLGEVDIDVALILLMPHFEPDFYLRNNPDVDDAGVDPMWHYYTVGWKECRNPSRDFDSCFYRQRHLLAESKFEALCPLLHYATVGRYAALSTSSTFEVAQREEILDRLWSSWFQDLQAQCGMPPIALDHPHVRRFILPMFDAQRYRHLHGLPDDLSDAAALVRYLTFDFPGGAPPGPLFDANYYASQVASMGVNIGTETSDLLHHWLGFGVDNRVSPTPVFDETEYLALNPDLWDFPDWLFVHFIRHGLDEGRQFLRVASAPWRGYPRNWMLSHQATISPRHTNLMIRRLNFVKCGTS